MTAGSAPMSQAHMSLFHGSVQVKVQVEPSLQVLELWNQICCGEENGRDDTQRLLACDGVNSECFTQKFPEVIFWKSSLATKENLSSN